MVVKCPLIDYEYRRPEMRSVEFNAVLSGHSLTTAVDAPWRVGVGPNCRWCLHLLQLSERGVHGGGGGISLQESHRFRTMDNTLRKFEQIPKSCHQPQDA
jgi:hypothetical protein